MKADKVVPQVGVGAIVFHNNAVLLVKRAQPPNANQWAIPGGRLKTGESLQQAAEREILEETGIHIKAGEPAFAFDLIQHNEHDVCTLHYVIIDLDAVYVSGEPIAGDDAAEAGWIKADEMATLPINPTTLHLLKTKYRFG
ncbi:MAG: NUDIX hydrolase [Gammaproteobacteria bacterium]|nr:NUDIX hydrolase [Gammaproteobacteria bacterium]MDH5650797.1 NUDIX hydrolase [Gammaproteobacteria bacterium]